MIGTTISHFRILDLLGKGGMGEVYLADDTHLNRQVAIKVLPEALQQDPLARKRMLREAKSAASLDHPFICKIYETGEAEDRSYIVLEYVKGTTLKDKLAEGLLPLRETLQIAMEVSEAIEKAHEGRIIHRDLKPANVMLTSEGHVKVMDFGLAKHLRNEGAEDFSMVLTREGTTVGTIPYMSPEQLRGDPIDTRSDIFSFGVLLYEMLTGSHPFLKRTSVDIVNAILNEVPSPLTRYLPDIPLMLQHIVKKMLAKEPDQRYQLIHEVRTDLRALIEEAGDSITKVVTGPSRVSSHSGWWRRPIPLALCALAVGSVLTGIGFWSLDSPPTQPPDSMKHFLINLSADEPLGGVGVNRDIFLSPDGSHLVLKVRNPESLEYGFRLRAMDQLDSTPFQGTDNATEVFFSPDSQWVGFFADGQLKKIPLLGGPAVTLCDVEDLTATGSWGEGNTIVFSSRGQLFRVSANGGKPTKLAGEAELPGRGLRWPQILPGGETVLFTEVAERSHIGVLSLETGETKVVVENGRQAQYLPTGHLVYGQPDVGTLLAVSFDLQQLEVTGDSAPVLEEVRQSSIGSVDYSVSNNGMLSYLSGQNRTMELPGEVVWVDRTGERVEPALEQMLEFPRYPRLSPDGQLLAVTTGLPNRGEIWIYDLSGRPPHPLALEGMNGRPVWTPDSRKVAFGSGKAISLDLFWIQADGSTLDREPLLQDSTTHRCPEFWTPDGKELIFERTNANGSQDIMALSLEGGRETRTIVETGYSATRPQRCGIASLSPDGQWLAYVSAVTGEAEIWVRDFGGIRAPVRISPRGGLEPVWSRDGQELFYLEGSKMMAVGIEAGDELHPAPPVVLFEGNYLHRNRRSYDVAADGRFLMIERAEGGPATTQVHVVLNWFEELKRLVSSN